MRIAVKYCGGCNPRFDRVALVRQLKTEFLEHIYDSAADGNIYDLLLIVCGCPTACAASGKNPTKNEVFILRREADLDKLRSIIRRH